MTEPDPWAELSTPPGPPGSGRQRYGAAMALHRAGSLGDAALEVYRIAAARDAIDPRLLLADRGIDLPAAAAAALPEALICALVEEADRYLAALPGPGVAEVRAGLAAARGGAVTPRAARPDPVVAAHLPAALHGLTASHPALAQAIAAAAPVLAWQPYDGYPPEAIGDSFSRSHSAAVIIGGAAPIAALDFDFGLFLIAPHVLYRDHHHSAPELYAPLTGPHGWRFGPDRPLAILAAHTPVWNPPNRPHLTKVGPVPFLCLYAWTRDVDLPAHVLPAHDWPVLEALRLVV